MLSVSVDIDHADYQFGPALRLEVETGLYLSGDLP